MKKKSNSPGKKISEGKAIVIAVLLFGAGLFVLIYVIQLIFNYFFPNFPL